MKVAILGGTGKLGTGLARLLAKKHDVYIGSRDAAKAEVAAKATGVKGGESRAIADLCDMAILTIPYEGIAALTSFKEQLSEKLVISPIVPMRVENGVYYYREMPDSAAQLVAKTLTRSKVAAALHTVPVRMLKHAGGLDLDVPVAADERKTFDEVAGVVQGMGGMRPLYVGPLAVASSLERLTPLLLNLATMNGLRSPSVKFVD